MAHTRGCFGIVQTGSEPIKNTIAEVRTWELEHSAEVLDASALGAACAKSYDVGPVTWSGSLACWWDAADTNGQETLDVGSAVTLVLMPSGAEVGETFYSGTAIITNIRRSGGVEGIVEAVFSFQGTGALTQGTNL